MEHCTKSVWCDIDVPYQHKKAPAEKEKKWQEYDFYAT